MVPDDVQRSLGALHTHTRPRTQHIPCSASKGGTHSCWVSGGWLSQRRACAVEVAAKDCARAVRAVWVG
eukprot:COSAG01_NODE_1173_length_11400_cov_2.767366_18_plen_69_part_00